MRKLVAKSFLFGFITGIAFFVIAPLGLAFSFLEFLSPILTPGAYIMRIFVNYYDVGALQWALAIGINILVYTLVFFIIFLLQNKPKNQGHF